jgi:hypothetical protein
MENSENKLTTIEKGEIFEYVNDLYLKLTGEKKKYTKRCFKTTWKEDNMCYKLLLGYNNVYDIWLKNEQNEEWAWERDNTITEGTITKKKHMRMINMMRESERYLEEELENIKDGKGYISEEQHKEEMDKQLQEQKQLIREQGDSIAKYKNESEMLRDKLDYANKRLEAQKLYFEDQFKKLSMD